MRISRQDYANKNINDTSERMDSDSNSDDGVDMQLQLDKDDDDDESRKLSSDDHEEDYN